MSTTCQIEDQRISIALATYNGERHIGEQLNSLARQSLPPWELIVTDDGSNDCTLELVEEFAKSANFPVQIVRNDRRLGYAANFLKAASLCTGPLIAFCDQDDCWKSDKLLVCSSFFRDPNVVLTTHAAAVWNGMSLTGNVFPDFEKTAINEPGTLDPLKLVPGFSMVFRSELLQLATKIPPPCHTLSIGNNADPMGHDSWLWFVGTTIGRVATISENLVLYRQHDKNTLGAPADTSLRRKLQLAIGNTQYSDLAKLETEYAEKALLIHAILPLQKNVYASSAAENFLRRAAFHRLRSKIYDSSTTFTGRCRAFSKLLWLGAYVDDRSNTCLGRRAAIKDFCFGLPGAHKWVNKA